MQSRCVDYYGLTEIEDYGPFTSKQLEVLKLIGNGSYSIAIERLQGQVKREKDDFVSLVMLVKTYHQADLLLEGSRFFRDLRLADRVKNPETGKWELRRQPRSFEIADHYLQILTTTHKSGAVESGARKPDAALSNTASQSRLEAMVLTSIHWWHRDLKGARSIASNYLDKDKGFYQLRVFYAHLLAHGIGPTQLANGSVDSSSAVPSNGKETMKQAEIVIRAHPDYAPAYFVASTSSDIALVRRNARRFMQGCHPESDWYKRAKAWLDKNK